MLNNSYSEAKNIEDYGILSIMYHRFEENKYPSTNVKLEDFKSQINLIEEYKYDFISHDQFEVLINENNLKKKILLTIDDGFSSFYENAWPVLKEKKIPFIIFINTETVGSRGYMNWSQIKEISQFNFVHIGNHSHSHEYLVDWSDDEIEKDLKTSIKLFKEKLNHETKFFAYPFGEYKKSYKEIVKKLGFEYAFGQHSGVMDKTKDKFELPRFPINEKYGEEKRFKSILQTIPFPYLKITPEEKYLNPKNNPPNVSITFFENGPNFKNITCYSNEENKWRKSKIKFINDNQLDIILEGKFTTERGRINCSLRENTGEWRWLGIQFVVSDL
jgi:peptidoglycan/xylan/chitin deacetylase (PgdA/CDA1 family)